MARKSRQATLRVRVFPNANYLEYFDIKSMEGSRNSCCANFLRAFKRKCLPLAIGAFSCRVKNGNSWLPYSSLKLKIAKIAAKPFVHLLRDRNDITPHTRIEICSSYYSTTIRRDYPSHWPCIAHHFKSIIQHNRSDICWYLGAWLIAFNSYHWQEVVDRWADSVTTKPTMMIYRYVVPIENQVA